MLTNRVMESKSIALNPLLFVSVILAPCRCCGTARMNVSSIDMLAARVASNVRCMVVNPLHKGLPRLVLMWIPTCLTFDAKGYVLPQWECLETQCGGRTWSRS